jgi:hypothetical protein
MSRYYDDTDDDDDFDVRHRPAERRLRPHSGPGMVAFVLAILAAIGAIGAIVALVILDVAGGPVADDDPAMIVTVLVFVGSMCTCFAGLVLGLVGAFQSDRNPTFAILGLCVNAFLFIGLSVVICAGILSEL